MGFSPSTFQEKNQDHTAQFSEKKLCPCWNAKHSQNRCLLPYVISPHLLITSVCNFSSSTDRWPHHTCFPLNVQPKQLPTNTIFPIVFWVSSKTRDVCGWFCVGLCGSDLCAVFFAHLCTHKYKVWKKLAQEVSCWRLQRKIWCIFWRLSKE